MSAMFAKRSGIVLRLEEDQAWDLLTLLRFKATDYTMGIEDAVYWEDLANKVEGQLREQLA